MLFSKSRVTLVLASMMVFSLVLANENPSSFQYQLIKQDNHEIHVLEIDPHDYRIISVKAAKDLKRETVSSMVKRHRALAGINGGFFEIGEKIDGRPAGALKINGEWIGFPLKNLLNIRA